MGSVEDAVAALSPLKARAYQLQVHMQNERAARLKRWEQSEKPILKEHAAGLKETMKLLGREETALQQRVANLASKSVRNHPGTSTGFNVIRARVDAYGKPLPTEALRAERDRLKRALTKIEVDIANAKAEITQHRRLEEAEIWETKLVALQDTKRVYVDEINLIEIELLGREHFERVEQERQHAEETGVAQLRRLQEQALQARIKFNRAKHQYYFSHLKGFNITFGGGGIYGACKDICISEINGAFKVSLEPGGVGEDGVYRSARMVVQVEAPFGARNNTRAASAEPSRRHSNTHASAGQQRTETSSSQGTARVPSNRPSSAPMAPQKSATAPNLPSNEQVTLSKVRKQSSSSMKATVGEDHLHAATTTTGASRDNPLARRAVSYPANSESGHHTRQQVAPGPTPAPSPLESRHSALTMSSVFTAPNGTNVNEVTSDGKAPRAKGFASRFIRRLTSRKEKFQGKEPPQLQPVRDEDDSTKQHRSLASKLLSRRESKRTSEHSLERLAFGGHELTRDSRRASLVSCSVEDDASVQISEGGETLELGEMDDKKPAFSDVLYEVDNYPNEVSGPQDEAGLDEGDGSLASTDDENDEDNGSGRQSYITAEGLTNSYLSKESLRLSESTDAPRIGGGFSEGRGSWLNSGFGGVKDDASQILDDASSSIVEMGEAEELEHMTGGSGGMPGGVFAMGRLSGFELVGERGSKVPNLTIGNADVRATVFARFVFEYSRTTGWRKGSGPDDRPVFHVDKLAYSLKGNNVPMPPRLIKHILRVAIPGLIQRRLLGLLPKEFGDYLIGADKGLEVTGNVAVVGPALEVLDADLGFEVRGPARSAKDARRQQARYAAAKEARSLLELGLPHAQVLAELFNGPNALLNPPCTASISQLIAFQAMYERHPKAYAQLCQVMDTAYHVLAHMQGRLDVADFSFPEFMAGPVARMRRKPARTRVVIHSMDVAINADAVVTALHDFTQRAIEELIVKGPLTDPHATLETMKQAMAEELEVLHAWHAFALRELQHFKSKFHSASGTALIAADRHGFSAGVENSYYEGPLRMRLPLNVQLDQDGAFSFDVPLPSPSGTLGVFMDNFKGLTVPAHLRPPAQALNWVELTGDSEVNERMRNQISNAINLIKEVINELGTKISQNGLEKDDEDPQNALAQPRTTIGDRLGRMIVNRLKVSVRLDERHIGEILSGIDRSSMGSDAAFTATAGRIIGHLGDVMLLGLTPATSSATPGVATAVSARPTPDRYLFQFESTDVSRIRADVRSLGFQSTVTPGGAVRLVHAVARAAMVAFMNRRQEDLDGFRDQMKSWYTLMTRESLNVSACVDTKGEVEEGSFIVRLSGRADEAALRATSPLVVTNEIDLVPLGKAMRGDADRTFPPVYRE